MATLFALEQHALNVDHLEADMLPELRTAKFVRDFQLHLKSYTSLSWYSQEALQPVATDNGQSRKKIKFLQQVLCSYRF